MTEKTEVKPANTNEIPAAELDKVVGGAIKVEATTIRMPPVVVTKSPVVTKLP